MFIPLSGFPTSYKNVFVIVSGLLVALIAFTSARAKRLNARRPRTPSQSRRESSPDVLDVPVSPPSVSPVPATDDTTTHAPEDRETPVS